MCPAVIVQSKSSADEVTYQLQSTLLVSEAAASKGKKVMAW
jgi:hypothetical protein